jgi:ankyrin repeat protein
MMPEKSDLRSQNLGDRLIQEAMLGNLPAVRQLVSDGADIGFANTKGGTPLMMAAYWTRLDVVGFLLGKGADVRPVERDTGRNVLMYACLSGSSESLKLILGAGMDVNATDCYGRTVLMMAAAIGRLGDVELLVNAGANVNARDEFGLTALELAAGQGSKEVVAFLSSKGAVTRGRRV